MKIEINNLGPIHKFDFDFDKDLYLIYGENNIGKSYIISAIYSILKNFLSDDNSVDFNFFSRNRIRKNRSNNKHFQTLLDSIKDKLDNNKTRQFSINSVCEQLVKDFVEQLFVGSIHQSFSNSFSNPNNIQNRLSNEEFSIKITGKEVELTFKLRDGIIYLQKLELLDSYNVRFIETNRETSWKVNSKPDDYDQLIFYVKKSGFDEEKFVGDIEAYCTFVVDRFIDEIKEYTSEIYFLPASRSGLYQAMSIFSTVFAKLSQLRHVLNKQIDIPALTEPVSDYFLGLSTIRNVDKKDRFSSLARKIEKEVLNASITFNADTKKLEYYNKKTNLSLDISDTSSMISEVAPIVAYLKYIIGLPKDEKKSIFDDDENEKPNSSRNIKNARLIFIEEPEAHLHPKIQAKMMAFFVEMVKNGVKVVMTTHSDFMFNKLTNLILEKKISSSQIGSYHLVMTPKGSIDKGDMQATPIGINDNNFVGIAEEIYEDRMRLYDLYNEENATKQN